MHHAEAGKSIKLEEDEAKSVKIKKDTKIVSVTDHDIVSSFFFRKRDHGVSSITGF